MTLIRKHARIVDMVVLTKTTEKKDEVFGILVETEDGSVWFYAKGDGVGPSPAPVPIKDVVQFMMGIAPLNKAINFLITNIGIDATGLSILAVYSTYCEITYSREEALANKTLFNGCWNIPSPEINSMIVLSSYKKEGGLVPNYFFRPKNEDGYVIQNDNPATAHIHDYHMLEDALTIPLTPVLAIMAKDLAEQGSTLRSIQGIAAIKSLEAPMVLVYKLPIHRKAVNRLFEGTGLAGRSSDLSCINVPHNAAKPITQILLWDYQRMTRENHLYINRSSGRFLIQLLNSKIKKMTTAEPEKMKAKVGRPKKTAEEKGKKLEVLKKVVDKFVKRSTPDPKKLAVEPIIVAQPKKEPIVTTITDNCYRPLPLAVESQKLFEKRKRNLSMEMIVGGNQDFIIGVSNNLPWHIPEDLKLFKEYTKRSILIMGRKTYDSLPVALPNRYIIVISRTPELVERKFPNQLMKVVGNLDEAITEATLLKLDGDYHSVIVAGGGELYRQAEELCSRIVYVMNNQSVFGPENEIVRYKPSDRFVCNESHELPTKQHGTLNIKLYLNANVMTR